MSAKLDYHDRTQCLAERIPFDNLIEQVILIGQVVSIKFYPIVLGGMFDGALKYAQVCSSLQLIFKSKKRSAF